MTCSSDSSSLPLLSPWLLAAAPLAPGYCPRPALHTVGGCSEKIAELKQLKMLPASPFPFPPCPGSPYLTTSTPDSPNPAPKQHSQSTGELCLTWAGISPPASLGQPEVGRVGVSTVISMSSLLG